MKDSELMKKYASIVEGRSREMDNLDDMQAEEAFEEFSEIKQDFDAAMERLENAIRAYLPGMKDNLNAYLIGHLKSALGGYGYHTYNSTLEDIVEGLEERVYDKKDEEERI